MGPTRNLERLHQHSVGADSAWCIETVIAEMQHCRNICIVNRRAKLNAGTKEDSGNTQLTAERARRASVHRCV